MNTIDAKDITAYRKRHVRRDSHQPVEMVR